MSNSPLVRYTKISPNKTTGRNHEIDTITIHCVVGHVSMQDIAGWFAQTEAKCSCNYYVDDNGNVACIVDEKDRSWCTSSGANDNRSVTIEVSSDKSDPYRVTDGALNGVIKLCADICKRNGIKKLLWKGQKSLIGQVDKQNMTVHRWFTNKSCPGEYLYSKHGYIADEVNKLLGESPYPVEPEKPEPAFKQYTVRITGAAVNYRQGPGTNYKINGVVRKGEVYTIVGESTGVGASKWGKLLSGAGWLALDYTQKT